MYQVNWIMLKKHDIYFVVGFLPSMIRRKQGHIVAVSSVQGKVSIPFRSACKTLFNMIKTDKSSFLLSFFYQEVISLKQW